MNIDRNKSDFNKTLAPWIGKTFKMMKSFVSERLKEHTNDVTMEQWIVLKILHEDHDGLVQNELAFITNRNKTTLTRLINSMEKKNLVARIPSKNDSRKNLIFLTKNGKELFLKIKPVILQCIEKMQAGLTKEEKEFFIEIMTKIQNNFKQLNS